MKSRIKFFLLVLLIASCDSHNTPQTFPEEFEQIKVMTFNVLYTTDNEATALTILESGADIIGLQEISKSRLIDLAQRLNYQYQGFANTVANMSDQDTGILSRFKIVQVFSNGVVVQVNKNLRAAIFTCHLTPYPYQPYDFRDGVISTAVQAVESAAFRLGEIEPVLDEMENAKDLGIPVFLTGDFNEPSHLDWTTETAAQNMHFNKAVIWPVSTAIAGDGWIDAWRSLFPNPINSPGITWTPGESASEVYDRIDIIYHSPSSSVELLDIRTVGGVNDPAGVKIDGYASDHYAVVATYKLKP
jgi:endonuclease/exonuclease/phosphatase family metal-dependent hydrolase